MSESREDEGGLGFLDSLGKLFWRDGDASEKSAKPPSRFERLEADFDTALQRLNEKIAEQRRAAASRGLGPAADERPARERPADRAQRLQAVHTAMRADIEAAHAQLGTGLAGKELDELGGYLKTLHASATPGRGSHSLLPRARYAIAEKVRKEAGELAVARLVAVLERSGRSWPDPTHYAPSATEEEIERSRRRRLGEIRDVFLASDFERTAQRMLGVVQGWGTDYPERGVPLWEECALEGVGAGIRAQLTREFVEIIRRDRELLLSRIEESVGKELAAVQHVLAGADVSIEQASKVVGSSLGVLDELVPTIAWEHVRSQLPSARGEFERLEA